ncbi:MAG: hypothetical protein Kow0099_10300 [Candidatus Abyssubacteria bacterium]
MVACFPDDLVRLLDEKCPPEQAHTLVLWTKNPTNLLEHDDLRRTCSRYHLYIHFTITGMGGGPLEPRVPPAHEMFRLLGPLSEYAGRPERVRIRFDPIVHLRLPNGESVCNLEQFEEVAAHARSHGIRDVSISWMSGYRKVRARLQKNGISEIQISEDARKKELDWLRAVAARHSLRLHGCCVPGMPVSRCIDGELLESMHPEKLPCSKTKAKGQRATCGCTESFDIGWYNPCPHGCMYCYANPAPSVVHAHEH